MVVELGRTEASTQRQPIDVLFHEEDNISNAQLYSMVYSSLCRVVALWDFSQSSLVYLVVSSLFSSHLHTHVGDTLEA